ncbi:MAG: hypothetical protein ABF856_10445 [Acetobacter aceti]|uniref:hypothetical protein n=1 Tax=Acetobacter aceti TaxID=435 RepID=UPI0011EA5AED|nr:hypothetical protein [Acetobacter aceti]
MSEKFSEALKYLDGNNLYGIWNDINSDVENNIHTSEAIKNLVDFFEFAIQKNLIVEYDVEKKIAKFSGDSPFVVSRRILGNFITHNNNLPEKNPLSDNDFFCYLLYKTGWAILKNGTKLITPDV